MVSGNVWQVLLKALGGFLVGLALLRALVPAYAVLLSALAEPVIRVSEDPKVTRLVGTGRQVIVDRSDFPPRSGRPGIPIDDLTFNFLILTTLFAANQRALGDRNIRRFLVATAVLMLLHLLMLIVAVKSIYALKLGAWSTAHYGALSRNFWGTVEHFYRVVGTYAVAFGLWWVLRPETPTGQESPKPFRSSRRKRPAGSKNRDR